MNFKDFIRECNQREVFKRISIYIVSSWVVLQVIVATWEPLGLPQKSVTFLILILLIGFPNYIYYLWVSRIKLTIVPEIDEDFVDPKSAKKFKIFYFSSLIFISVLSLLGSGLIIKNNFFKRDFTLNIETSDKIAVLDFENNTGNDELKVIGKMTADWIISGITENNIGEVISSDIIEDHLNLLDTKITPDDSSILNNLFKTEKVINGSYFLNNNNLILNCTIINGQGGTVLTSFNPVNCPEDDPLQCIEQLRQDILNYLVDIEKGDLSIEVQPPKYEAYKTFLNAESNYDDSALYLELLEKSIAIDSNFFEPQVLRVQHYYNKGDFKKADSLLKRFENNTKISNRQRYILNFCDALMKGKNNRIYQNFKHEYDIAPYHMATNQTMMVLAQQYVNKPELVEDMFLQIDMKDMNIENCQYCVFRYFAMALAYNELGSYQKSIDILESLIKIIDATYLKKALITSYIESESNGKLQVFIEQQELSANTEQYHIILLQAATRYLIKNNQATANTYLDRILKDDTASVKNRAMALYYSKDYANAAKAFELLISEQNNSLDFITKLAISMHFNNQNSQQIINRLESERGTYQYGRVDYCYAQYHAAIGNDSSALKYLQKSIIRGNKYYPHNFKNDPHFSKYKDHPIFQTIMTYWH